MVYVDELCILCEQLLAYIAEPASALQEKSSILLRLDAIAAAYGSLTRFLTLLRCILVFSAAHFSADFEVRVQTISRA